MRGRRDTVRDLPVRTERRKECWRSALPKIAWAQSGRTPRLALDCSPRAVGACCCPVAAGGAAVVAGEVAVNVLVIKHAEKRIAGVHNCAPQHFDLSATDSSQTEHTLVQALCRRLQTITATKKKIQ